MTTNEKTDKIIFGVFTHDEVNDLQNKYELQGDAIGSLKEIATPLFRQHHIRSYDEASEEVRDAIRVAFLNIQQMVLCTPVVRYIKVEHKKGEMILDEKGKPIPTDDGRDYKKYTKDVIENQEKKEMKPYYDTRKDRGALNDLMRKLKEIEVKPDYDVLRKKYLAEIDFKKGCDLLRKITEFYIFEEPDKFVERFALLICNAKAKALGYQPKWPVLFSLVGKMGVGKSWLAQMVKETHDKAFECRSGVTSYGRLLDGQFNAMMMTRGFLSLDEAQGLDKTQCEKLKTYITSQKVDIERKGVDVQTCDNLVTFFSTTNESVKDVMGYQPDRRIVEFTILNKKGEIPEDDVRKWLDEIWRVMPVEHPTQQAIKDELLKDSNMVLDVKMEEIVYGLFKGREYELMDSKNRLNQFKFRKAVRDIGGVPFSRVRDWCADKGILKKDGSGHICVMKKELNEFMESHGDETRTPGFLKDLFNTED